MPIIRTWEIDVSAGINHTYSELQYKYNVRFITSKCSVLKCLLKKKYISIINKMYTNMTNKTTHYAELHLSE